MGKNGGIFRLVPGIAGLTDKQVQAAKSEVSRQGIALPQAVY